MRFATKAIHVGQDPENPNRATVPPIYMTSTYTWESLESQPPHMYTRESNPTRDALEKCLASLENARFALSYGSGMAAEAGACSLAKAGERILCSVDLYGGTYFLCQKLLTEYGIETEYVDCTDEEAVQAALEKKPRLFWLESPTNPLLTVLDLKKLAALGKAAGATVVVDNTFATPYLQNPLELGADVVVHSATKYIGGHSDVMGGFVATNDEALHERLIAHRIGTGGILSPFDAFLFQRGLKTLAVRMKEHERNAMAVARFLSEHSAVEKTYYPGLPNDPNHALARSQMRGFGGMVSFTIQGSGETAARFLNNLKLFALAASLGGVESLAGYPVLMSHFFVAPEERERRGITDRLIRLSVGIEDEADLLDDLAQALRSV